MRSFFTQHVTSGSVAGIVNCRQRRRGGSSSSGCRAWVNRCQHRRHERPPGGKWAIADAGGDATTIATWIAQVNAPRAAALAQRDTATAQIQAPDRLTEEDIRRLVGSFDNIRNTLRDARSEDKRTVYRELRLALTYNPGQNKISVEAKPDADYCGVTVRVRGATRTVTPPPITIVKTLKPTQALEPR